MKTKSKFFISAVFLIAVVSFTACHSSNESKNESASVADFPTVLVAQPKINSFENSFSLAGEAMANQEVKLYAMSNGYVKMWKYDIGDMVKKGHTLAVLSNPEIIEEQEKAKAELDGDASIYNRLEGVYKKTPELVPMEQVDESKAKYESAVAALNVVDSEISYLTVRAPFDGIITNRYVDTGAIVQNGLDRPYTEPLFKIQDISIIRVNVSIPEVSSPYIVQGTPVTVTFTDLPNTVFNAKVSRISYGLNEDTKTMLAQVDISNKNHLVHPGMFANVNFKVSAADSSLSIPNQAVAAYEQQTYVYKVVPVDSTSVNPNWMNGVKCIVRKVNIQPGISNGQYTQVKYGVLKTTDMIIISGNTQCTDGSTVIAKTGKGL